MVTNYIHAKNRAAMVCRGGVGGRKDQTYTYVKTAQADGVFILSTLLSLPLQNRWKNNLDRTVGLIRKEKHSNSAHNPSHYHHPPKSFSQGHMVIGSRTMGN